MFPWQPLFYLAPSTMGSRMTRGGGPIFRSRGAESGTHRQFQGRCVINFGNRVRVKSVALKLGNFRDGNQVPVSGRFSKTQFFLPKKSPNSTKIRPELIHNAA